LNRWDTFLRFLNRVQPDLHDPILGKGTGFYLFILPFYDALFGLFLRLSITALVSLFLALFIRLDECCWRQ
jgi:uncharacterized membrane protein (UPF0182 family)